MHNLLNNDKKTYYLAIGAIGLILTHNVITVYTALFCIIYLLVNYKKISFKVVKNMIINIVIILLCTSFYWLPLFEHFFATTYEVFIPNRMYSNSTIVSSKLDVLDLFINKRWNMNFHIGIPIILGIILFIIYFKKIKETNYKNEIILFLIFGIISIIMCLKIFPFEYMPDFLKMLQFTWRMQEFANFFLSIVAGITISIFIGNSNTKLLLINIFIILNWLVLMLNNNCYTSEVFNEQEYLQPIPVTQNTKRVHAGCATFEYLPKNAFANLDYIKTRSKHAIITQGIANIVDEEKNGTNMSFKLKSIDEVSSVKIELPYIYYLGYSAKLKDENGNITNVEIKESDKGFCMIEISNIQVGTVEISYTGTTLMKVSYIMTILGFIFVVIYYKFIIDYI